MTNRHEVCPADEFPPGERRIVDVDGTSIGIFNVDGEYYGLRNVCPHQMAPLCEGTVTGTFSSSSVGEYSWTDDGRIVRCPWHGWEFDVTTGESTFEPDHWRIQTYEATVESPERECPVDDPETTVETYPVEVSEGVVVVYV
jgi:nitrite reductase/ring-hydroxylating ferredoxin subunit